MAFEQAGYTDKLLAEVGIKTHRKAWGMNPWKLIRLEALLSLREEYVRLYGGGDKQVVRVEQ